MCEDNKWDEQKVVLGFSDPSTFVSFRFAFIFFVSLLSLVHFSSCFVLFLSCFIMISFIVFIINRSLADVRRACRTQDDGVASRCLFGLRVVLNAFRSIT